MSEFYNKSRKRLIIRAQALEEGEIIDNQSARIEGLEPFSDGFDDQLLGDAEDRARLQVLSELEREKEIYQRSLRRDNLRREWDIKCHLAKEKVSKLCSAEIEIKERSKVRRLSLGEQRAGNQRGSAFGRLKAMRHNRKMTKESPETSKIRKHESPQQLPMRKIKLRATDIYSDDSSNSDLEVPPEQRLVSTLNELSRALLTRDQLESFLDKPIFDKTITDCFVRVNFGHINQVYRLSQIAGLQHSKREYRLGSKNTNLLLRLRNAGQYVYTQMDVISNQPVTPLEFDAWVSTCQREGLPLPQLGSIEKKEKAIAEATNYAFTEADVEKLVQTKLKDGKKESLNDAYRKVCLITERDMAVNWNELKKDSIRAQPKRVPSNNLPATKSLADRLPKSNDFDLEHFMRRKYKKSTVVSRSRHVVKEWENDSSVTLTSDEKDKKEVNNTKNDDEQQKLDLYELNDFEVVLDMNSLPPLSAILKDIKS